MSRPALKVAQAPVPPQNLDAEESVLGAILLGGSKVIDNVAEIVAADDFYRHSHGKILRACLALDDRSEPVDAITVVAELERRRELEEVGGRTRIHELAALALVTANAAHYAKIVREKAVRRSLITAGTQIAELGWEQAGHLDEVLVAAERHFAEGTAGAAPSQQPDEMSDVLDSLLAEVMLAREEGRDLTGVLTGIRDLDHLTQGLHPGQLVVLAGRPGMGKSLLAQTIAENVARRGERVLVVSLEMSSKSIASRLYAKLAKVPSHLLRFPTRLSEEQVAALHAAARAFREPPSPWSIEQRTNLSVTQIRGIARRLKRKQGLALVIVDYLQLLVTEGGGSADNRQNEVAAISRSLKLLARELEVPVMALSSLNRAVEARADKRPGLGDLRDSGAIEADADIVLMLYREEAYKPVEPQDAGILEVNVAKNRDGETKTLRLSFRANLLAIGDLAAGLIEP